MAKKTIVSRAKAVVRATPYGQKVEVLSPKSQFALETKPNWRYVNSSNLDAVAYNKIEKIMWIRFLGSKKKPQMRIYAYYSVPEWEYRGLLNASSKGQYVWQHIKGKYKYTEVT